MSDILDAFKTQYEKATAEILTTINDPQARAVIAEILPELAKDGMLLATLDEDDPKRDIVKARITSNFNATVYQAGRVETVAIRQAKELASGILSAIAQAGAAAIMHAPV